MRARSMLFTLFGDYVRHYGWTIWIGSLIALMAELDFTASAVRAAVSRMSRQGWLVPSRAGRASYYALTPRGGDRIEEAAARIFKLSPEPWDRRWRLLVVPSAGPARERRAGLRRELEWMGFARIAPGQYISPNDLVARLGAVEERYGLAGRIETFVGRHAAGSTDEALVARAWDLEAIDAAYEGFLAAWQPRLDARRRASAEVPDAEAFAEKTRLVHEFRKLLFIDPGLPQELLPPRWSGLEARGVFSAYYHLLAEGALRCFEAHYRPAPGREADLPDGRRAARRDPFRPAVPAAPGQPP